MLAYKLFPSGLNSLTIAAIQDVATGLTAAGTNQATAYQVTSARNQFSTVASGTGAILDSSAAPGDSQLIYNGGANVLKVYPTTGAKINNLATNAAASIGTNTACEFTMMSTTQWVAILSA